MQGNIRSTLLCTSVRYFGTKHRVNVVEIKAQTGGRFSQMRKRKFTCGNGDAVCFYKHLKKGGHSKELTEFERGTVIGCQSSIGQFVK